MRDEGVRKEGVMGRGEDLIKILCCLMVYEGRPLRIH